MPSLTPNPTSPRSPSPLAIAAQQAANTGSLAEIANRGGTTESVIVIQPPLAAEAQRAMLGFSMPMFQTTLAASQTIPAGSSAVLFFPLTIGSGVTLTIEGFLAITNLTYNAAA